MTLRRGFSLIELLVVVAILALVMGMVMTSTGSYDREAVVKAAAEQFAGTCRQARARAVADRAPYGIAINIQNAPGSSGKVVNNRSGGHWYRMVGTYRYPAAGPRRLLMATINNLEISDPANARDRGGGFTTFPEFAEALKETWTGPQIALPPGKVRFLALGDTDEGARVNAGNQGASVRAGGYGYTATYPRPYFGYFDAAAGRLYPWGGYDPALHTAQPWNNYSGGNPAGNYSGFFYQGSGPAVVGCVNPETRTWLVDWNKNGSISAADVDPVHGAETTGYPVFTAGEPRPLVSGEWQDFLIMFLPDGSVHVPPFKTNRKRFAAVQYDVSASGPVNRTTIHANGVLDTTRGWFRLGMDPGTGATSPGFKAGWNNPAWKFTTPLLTLSQNATDWRGLVETGEVGHFDAHTGAWRITLAPDSSDDRDTFPDAKEALATISPMFRVELSRGGGVRVVRVKTPRDDVISGLDVWPPTPGWFEDPAHAGTLGTTFRYGWLHRDTDNGGRPLTDTTGYPEDLVPVGRPITDMVCPRMLRDKIWWVAP